VDLAQEGLGLGAVALKRRGLTYFPRASLSREEGGIITKEYVVDSAMVFQSPYLPLARVMPLYGLGTKVYMELPGGQDKFLELRSKLFSWFDVRPAFRPVGTVATATFVHRPEAGSVKVACTVRSTDGPLPTTFVMNELGAEHFDRSIRAGKVGSAPTGWCELPMTMPTPALLDPRKGTTFFIDRLRCCEGSGPRLFWGREHSDGLCWAGFEVELSNPGGLTSVELNYEVRFGTVGE
jgi:hypothetical protein